MSCRTTTGLRLILSGMGLLALSACINPQADPAAPGAWFWFETATAAERTAYYTERCGGDPACVRAALQRQAIETCRIDQLGDFREIEDPRERAEELERDRRNCANRLLQPHGINVR